MPGDYRESEVQVKLVGSWSHERVLDSWPGWRAWKFVHAVQCAWLQNLVQKTTSDKRRSRILQREVLRSGCKARTHLRCALPPLSSLDAQLVSRATRFAIEDYNRAYKPE